MTSPLFPQTTVRHAVLTMSLLALATAPAFGQTLTDELLRSSSADLAQAARTQGDAARGAVLFFQQQMACSKCHSVGGGATSTLGPDLAKLPRETTDESLIESVLTPSKVIRQGFETVTLVTKDGRSLTGLLASRTADRIVLRDAARLGEEASYQLSELEAVVPGTVSIMPAGQMNQLASRQQFLDLIRYLMEIRQGGEARARELQPSPALLVLKVPEYEQHIDHAGFLRDWNNDSYKRGEAIYRRVCMNCHGTKDQPGSLPTSLPFASGKFRNGSDPFTMYQTLTRGFGLMAAQTWMVPSQKYDVIHYIREAYLKPHNPSQYSELSGQYLARLPQGDSRGPAPSKIQPWNAMDYGPSLTHTWEVPGPVHNFAYKGLAVRLDPGAGGVSRGRHWMVFDTDTLRMAAAWSAADPPSAEQNFVDWRGIQFNGEHQIHPALTGHVVGQNGTGPGWANPATGEFLDDQRVLGRDDRRYGPLPRAWGRFRGVYLHQQNVISSYTIGQTAILEMPSVELNGDDNEPPSFLRTFNIGPRERDLVLRVVQQPGGTMTEASQANREVDGGSNKPSNAERAALGSVVSFGPDAATRGARLTNSVNFDGRTFLRVAGAGAFDLSGQDFSITARVKTRANGSLFSLMNSSGERIDGGLALIIRDGRLCCDAGTHGTVTSKRRIHDGKWHDVAAVWTKATGQLRLVIDGRDDGAGQIQPMKSPDGAEIRIGFTPSGMEGLETHFSGDLDTVRYFQRALGDELKSRERLEDCRDGLVAMWTLAGTTGPVVNDTSGHLHEANVLRDESRAPSTPPVLAGFAPTTCPLRWSSRDDFLLLTIPAGQEPLRFTVWLKENRHGAQHPNNGPRALNASLAPPIPQSDRDLGSLTHGGPPRWPQKIVTTAQRGPDDGPFAADVLTAPEINPWQAQVRFTGLDFFADGRMAICTWDGDVWIVEGFLEGEKLTWQRIASGLFQPLGLKIVDEKIHLTCRDQLVVLHDLNGDQEIDFYECLNNDHQVTEHFHEFAMGLQTDAAGDFYYAKSGRHALEAVVPHHGTLLKVTKDGSKTEILANGFRAANGVCLNPDGSFFVTDQEGFWNPKNRINWVTLSPDHKPKFYGNMFGYHDVRDSSDDAMEPPLCWITNAFDRSPAELLWVDSQRWGPLNGALLNLSYGYGKVFLVLHEKVHHPSKGDLMQGGMIELPIPSFPTGVMRGRFHPRDQQLYLCGMFAWAGNATAPGGLYRLRATGRESHLPLELHAEQSQLRLVFSEPLDPSSIDASNIQLKSWDLKRSAKYGSDHFNEKRLTVDVAALSADGKTLTLSVPQLRPTWCMEVRYSLKSHDGKPVNGVIHSTIHVLNPAK